MGELRPWHIIILVAVIFVLFGYKKLPDATRSLGRSLRILKTEVKSLHEDDDTKSSPPATSTSSSAAAPAVEQATAAPRAVEAPRTVEAPRPSVPEAPAVNAGASPSAPDADQR
jgi:sec-independent protein translocase protein TatA